MNERQGSTHQGVDVLSDLRLKYQDPLWLCKS